MTDFTPLPPAGNWRHRRFYGPHSAELGALTIAAEGEARGQEALARSARHTLALLRAARKRREEH